MKYFYIIANYNKEYAKETEKQIRTYLQEWGAVCWSNVPREDCSGDGRTRKEDIPEKTQCLISIGGDGTLIRAARNLAGLNIPILGVNRGHLGYLNQVNRDDDLEPALDQLLEDRFQIEERMMLCGEAWKGDSLAMKDIALNEIALIRKSVLNALRFLVYVNGQYLSRYSADGIIVSTPTGSTAYNMSAGGPLVAPGARMMIMTPICSHELNARSIVLEPKDQIQIEVFGDGQVASFDGDTFVELEEGGPAGDPQIQCGYAYDPLERDFLYAKFEQPYVREDMMMLGIRRRQEMKIERHSKIVELIGKYQIETQEELAEKLNKAGFNVTQATVSRDIRELKLTKIQGENGRQHYVVLEGPKGTSAEKYIRILRDGFTSMDMAQNILVIKTVSGMAMAVAAALDAIHFSEVVGCIAGDDTIMCAIRSVDDTIIVMEKIKKMVEES